MNIIIIIFNASYNVELSLKNCSFSLHIYLLWRYVNEEIHVLLAHFSIKNSWCTTVYFLLQLIDMCYLSKLNNF